MAMHNSTPANGRYRYHDRAIGRWRRPLRWAVFGNVIFPDWREVRSGFARGKLPASPG